MPKVTPLAQGQITPVSAILIELHEDADTPAAARERGLVLISWPLQPTMIDPAQFRDTAAAMVKLFSDAHIALAGIRGRRRL
jgi:hypothetical protein